MVKQNACHAAHAVASGYLYTPATVTHQRVSYIIRHLAVSHTWSAFMPAWLIHQYSQCRFIACVMRVNEV